MSESVAREHPFQNPLYRYGAAFTSATIIVAIAVFYLEGIVRWVAFGVAVVEVTLVPHLLEMVARQAEEADEEYTGEEY